MKVAVLVRRRLYGSTADFSGVADIYAVAGFSPSLVFDFDSEFYRTGGSTTTFDAAMTHTRSGNATMVDSDGVLKWAPHNLALNSATPATQSITVVSGADYTVECTGVSIALSGAGTGTATEGSPVEITAGTTTLTLTVTGSTGTMWVYRSDLGGMVSVPEDARATPSATTYVPTTSAARYLPRRGHRIYNGAEWVNEGVLVESEARTNLLLNSGTLATQNVTVTAVPHTLHFTGTGTITLSGASTAGPLVGTGTGENNRVSLTFTPTAGTLTLTVSGTVTNADLEVGSTPSSHKPTSGSTVTRAADTITVPYANLPYDATAMSIQVDGTVTGNSYTPTRWYLDANNAILQDIGSTDFTFTQEAAGVVDTVTGGSFTSGINVPYNIASRHGSTFINGAVDGTALTADTTPTALPNLSSTSLNLGFDYMGTIKTLRMWSDDLGDSGIATATIANNALVVGGDYFLTSDGEYFILQEA
jgi:hypothetical protein